MKIKPLLLYFILGSLYCNAQVGIGTPLPNNSSQLDVVAANRGVLITRVQLQSTTNMSPIVNTGSLPSSLLVFNEASAGTAPLNVTPGYYYWFNNRWNRVLVSSDATVQEGTVIYNPVSNTFSYIDQSGNQQIINLQDIIKDNETITTLINATDGKHTYTSENNTVTVIDVVGDVTTNALTIFNNTAVLTELTTIIKNNETLTSLVYDAPANTLTYNAENGTPTVVNLLNLVQGAETQTSLIYDATAQTLTYNPENGVPTVIDLDSLVTGSETVTTITPVVITGNTIANYSNEAGTPVAIQETITTQNQNLGTGDITYTNESGASSVSKVTSANTGNLIVTGSDGGSFINNAVIKTNETITTVTPINTTGNLIAQYTNEAANDFEIRESITSLNPLVSNGNIIATFINEAGGAPAEVRETTTKIIPVVSGNIIANYLNEEGLQTNIEETVTTLSYDPLLSTLNYSNESGTSTPLDLSGLKSIVTAGTNVTVTGNGSSATPYVINSPIETALLTPSTAITASATTVAVPSVNVQGAIGDLATELKQKWDIRGNTGTVAGTNFLGTTDDIDLVFKRNNVVSGIITGNNTGLGFNSLNLIGTGFANVAIGANSLQANTVGSLNSAVGYSALNRNISGDSNAAFGITALEYNTSGSTNVAIGSSALRQNTTGNSNVAVGVGTIEYNTTGYFNSAVGTQALANNQIGFENVAMGKTSLSGNISGNLNTAIGTSAMNSNVSGNNNIAIGAQSLRSNTTGNNNIANGYRSLYNTTASNNVSTGNSALFSNTIGTTNTAMGNNALYSNDGSGNVAIGFDSARYFGVAGTNVVIAANNSVYIGTQVRPFANNDTNEIVIGYQALGRGDNTVQIGNAGMTNIGGQVAWSNPSDLRLKKDIETSAFGLNFINKLRPVTYHLKTGTTDLQSGFIAQEVESSANAIGYHFSGVVKPASEKDFYSLRYSEFVVPLVKAVQEQQAIIERQDKKITDLESRLQGLEEMVNKLK